MTDQTETPEAPVARTRARPPQTFQVTGELAEMMNKVSKDYGDHVMKRATEKAAFLHIPTGIFTLDLALLGGIPEGLCTMLYGWESSGKSTLAMRMAGQCQKKYPDKAVVLIDAEGTYDPLWGAKHGVDNTRLILVQPETGEQAVDFADGALRARETAMVIVDSLPALVPMKELERSAEDRGVGEQARMIGTFLRKAQQAMLDERKRGHTPTLILINQWRYKIGVMHGDPRTLPGGVALKYVHSVGIEVLNKEHLGKDARDTEIVDYNEHGFRIKKNKIGNSIRAGEFVMVRNPDHPLGAGFIDDAKTVVTWGRKFGLITGGGSSWRIDGLEDRFSKLQEMADYFYSDLDFYEAFQRRLVSLQRQAMGLSHDGWY